MEDKKIKIICADDEQGIHDGLDRMVAEINKSEEFFKLQIIEHFYNTDDLKDFLQDGNNEIDILLLDIDFKGSESGIEALEVIRNLEPSLNITLLSAYDDTGLIIPANKKYNVKYLKKPISSNELLIHINEIKEQQDKYDKLKSDLKVYEDWINHIEQEEEAKIPKGLTELITEIFNNITFTIQALKDLIVCSDYRVYNTLKIIDLKLPTTNGMYEKSIKGKVKNYDKIKEYRFSQKGRIFVSYQTLKPVVVCIDQNHRIFA